MSDVRNAAERLRKLLRAAQFPQLQALNLEAGEVSDLLRILHFVLLDSSRAVAQFLVAKGYDLYGKTDARFVESAFRLLRDEFRCFPTLSVAQFLSKHFVARRLNLVADAAAAAAQKRQELLRQKRSQEAVWSQPQDRAKKTTVENHVLPTAVVNHAARILEQLQVQTEHKDRRRVGSTRDSREIPTGERGLNLETAIPPAPVFIRKEDDYVPHETEQSMRDNAYASHDHNNIAANSSAQTNRMPLSCCCSQDSDALKVAMHDLSRQLSEVSATLISKMSSVETRLDRLETQIRGVQVIVEEQRYKESQQSRRRDSLQRGSGGEPIKTAELAGTRRTLDGEPSCAWPPQPSVFERY